MNAFDYYSNPKIKGYIDSEVAYIKNAEDREDCRQEIWANLYDFMPLDITEARRLIKKTCEKFKRGVKNIYENECELKDCLRSSNGRAAVS